MIERAVYLLMGVIVGIALCRYGKRRDTGKDWVTGRPREKP